MVKNKVLAILAASLFIAASSISFSSCKDESGKYVGYLYTDAQKELAIKTCLANSCDTAFNRLFTHNGFYSNNNGLYCIDFEPIKSSIFDTLANHGKGALCDTLILLTNRMAESCGTQILPYFKKAIDTLEIIDANYLIDGSNDAITNYYKLFEKEYLRNAISTPVSIRSNLQGVTSTWTDIRNEYFQYSNAPITFDIHNYILEKMLYAVFEEMKNEEALIRTDSTHRNDATELLAK